MWYWGKVVKRVQYGIKGFLFIALSILSLILIIGCVIPISDLSSGFGEADDPGWFKFFSNDPVDYQRAFSYLIDGSYQDAFVSSEIIVKKNSGYEYSDYGMVFCASGDSYLALVIDTQKSYRVFKSVNGTITQLIDWTYSDALLSGYGTQNNLRVEQSTSGNFDIYLNTTFTASFNETGLIYGSNGFFVYVASENYENLDIDPVEVLYAEK